MAEVSCAPLVLLTIGCLDIGGAERRLLQLARHLKATSTPVRLAFFVVSGRKGRLEDEFREVGCNIHYGRPGLIGLVDLARLCMSVNPTVLHANAETASGFYCLAARVAGVPRVISHMRTSRAIGDSGSARSWIYGVLTGLVSNTVIGVSKTALAGKYFGSVERKVIYNGLDPAELAAAKNSHPPEGFGGVGPDFVILGRLDRSKNMPHGIRAFGLYARDRGEKAGRLHIVGPEGNISAEELREVAREARIEDRVLFHGPTIEPLPFLFHASCALLASDYEGLPGVALEALSCGTPLIASDIPSTREVMQLSVGIEVVPVSNLQGWADAMSRALDLDRDFIRDQFWAKSPFSLSRYAQEMVEAWGIVANRAET